MEEQCGQPDFDQIEGDEFKFLGLEMRFLRNSDIKNLQFDFEDLEPEIKILAWSSSIASRKKYASKFSQDLTVGYPAKQKLSLAKIDSCSYIVVQNRARGALVF